MTPRIGSSQGLDLPQISGPAPVAAPASPDVDFGSELGRALEEAGKAEQTADSAAQRFAAGDPQVGMHEVMIAAEKANVAVRYAVTLKNRLIGAYKELMETQI